jgi:phage protein U
MSFAALGSVSFEVIASPTQMETTDAWHYAEFKLVEAKPTLQWIGDELRKISFTLVLHQAYADPVNDFAALSAMAEQHQPVPFVLGNGTNIGNFVIKEIKRTDDWMSDQGDPIKLTADVQLLEWSGAMPAGAPGQQAATTIGVIGANGDGATAVYAQGSDLGQPVPTLDYQSVPVATMLRSG